MRTHEIYAIDKKDLCATGCQRIAVQGLRVLDDGDETIVMKVCLPCLREQVGEKEYQSR